MTWAKAALAGGLLLLFVGFGFGTQPGSTSVDKVTYRCDAAVRATWLVAGTNVGGSARGQSSTADERKVDAACGTVVHRERVLLWSMLGVGGLLALGGLTALREGADGRSIRRRGSLAGVA